MASGKASESKSAVTVGSRLQASKDNLIVQIDRPFSILQIVEVDHIIKVGAN